MRIKDKTQFGGVTFSSGGGASLKLWLSGHKKLDPIRAFIEEHGRAKHVLSLGIDLGDHGKFKLPVQYKDAGEKIGLGAFVTLSMGDISTIAPFESFAIRKQKGAGVEEGEPISITLGYTSEEEEEKAHKREERKDNERGPYGFVAQHLFKAGFFYNRKLYKYVGTDDEYLEWVRTQPSAIDGSFSEYVDSVGRCEAAHFKDVGRGSGMGYKPEYSAIPLTHTQHHHQHLAGYEGVGGKEWFDRQVSLHVAKWAKLALCNVMGITSLSYLDPVTFIEWCATKDDIVIPAAYLKAAQEIGDV